MKPDVHQQTNMPRLLKPDASALLVIDAQERLVPAMSAPDEAVARIALLGKAADRLQVPVLASEQYPRGLGHTVPALAGIIGTGTVVEKTEFCLAEATGVAGWLETHGRRQVIVTGFEAHICVLQSALGFREAGYDVFVVADGVGSRRLSDHEVAMHRLRGNGVAVVTSEMVVFEWLGRSGAPEFKELSRLVK